MKKLTKEFCIPENVRYNGPSIPAKHLSYDYESRVTGITYPSLATNSFTYKRLRQKSN